MCANIEIVFMNKRIYAWRETRVTRRFYAFVGYLQKSVSTIEWTDWDWNGCWMVSTLYIQTENCSHNVLCSSRWMANNTVSSVKGIRSFGYCVPIEYTNYCCFRDDYSNYIIDGARVEWKVHTHVIDVRNKLARSLICRCTHDYCVYIFILNECEF